MNTNTKFLLSLITISLLLVCSSLLLPIEFTAINGFSADLWLFISDSGGVIGVPIIVLLFSIIIGSKRDKLKQKLLVSVLIFSLIIGLISSLAKINEHIIKEKFQLKRPYTSLLKSHFNFPSGEFYALQTKEERSEYFGKFVSKLEDKINLSVSKPIIKHWQHESGYSFPSGHSVSAFLMASLLSYLLLTVFKNRKAKLIASGIMIWAVSVAISRVTVGAHSALDVSMGAFFGSAVAFLLIISGAVNKLLQKMNLGDK